VTAYYGRGKCHFSKANLDNALEDFDKTIEIENRYHLSYFMRGVIYHRKKDYKRAVENCKKAIELDKTFA
jgi:tetratricopeptide (TPR) repeat protein